MRTLRTFGFRRAVALVGLTLLTAGALTWASQSSVAVDDTGMFELDGNIVHNSANTPPYDWASLFDANGNRLIAPDPDNGPLLASVFIQDTATPDPTYFESNKDIEPIADWACGPINNPTNKDDVLNAYAALVQIPANAPDNAGHTVLYLGQERDSNNGTSFAGFWLLKNSGVGCNPPGEFTGGHTDGDLLVVSDFTNGGGTQDVTVYRWTGNDATGVLVEQVAFRGSVCASGGTDNACAIANTTTVSSPWAPTSHDTNEFVEAGIDMTALLGQAGGCFTTFMAETRTSAETTATLKDYAGGQFNTCPPPPIATTATPGGDFVVPGSAQHDVANVSPVGNRPTPTGSVEFFLCQPNQVTAGGCETGGTSVGSEVLNNGQATSDDVSGATTTALGKYCWRAEYTPDAAGALNYVPSSHTNSTTECFTVVKSSPLLATQINVGGSEPGTLGLTELGDTATLTGFAGDVTGESIAFNLYGPYGVNDVPDCQPAQLVFGTTGNLNAQGVATTSATFSPTAAGVYVWVAAYGGDAANNPATHPCNQANEKVSITGAVVTVTKSANPDGPVSSGDTIGFDITVTNGLIASALGVVVDDDLPGTGTLNWSLNPAFPGCAITGAVGSQHLHCDLGDLDKGESVGPIHVESATAFVDCGTISNTAVMTTTNGTGGQSSDSVDVLCPDVTLDKLADSAEVSAGTAIGFTITATNSDAEGTGTANGVVINDPLPSGPGINWSIESGPINCSIEGAPPTQTLVCTAFSLAPGESLVVHIVSATVFESCATYDNTATATVANGPVAPAGPDQLLLPVPILASDSVQVDCPALTIIKTADDANVPLGSTIGFTITVENAGPGVATGVTVHDPLPPAPGVEWKIDPAYPGPGICVITGPSDNQTLDCSLGDLAAEAVASVHIVSDTTVDSCGLFLNTATLSANNHPSIEADAQTNVVCAAPEEPPTHGPAATGAEVGGQLNWAAALLISGMLFLLMGSIKRKPGRHH